MGGVGWGIMGRRPSVVPVIEADSRPIRIKPENPGGMQIAGADEMTSGDGAPGGNKMAPVAETPAPQALRAQMQAEAPVVAVPAPLVAPPLVAAPLVAAPLIAAPGAADPAVKAPAASAPGVAPPVVSASPAAPGPSPLPDTPAKVGAKAPAAVPVRPAGGGTMVQLGALGSEAAAQAEWQRLSRSLPELFGGRQPVVQKAERDGKTFWRLRTAGFADMADATGFCGKLRAKGGNCTIASF